MTTYLYLERKGENGCTSQRLTKQHFIYLHARNNNCRHSNPSKQNNDGVNEVAAADGFEGALPATAGETA